jgi:hypothetical protein
MGFYIWGEWEDAVTTGVKLSEVSTTNLKKRGEK